MKITIRPMTIDEAWKYIVFMHTSYHHSLKNFGYGYENFIPSVDFIKEMFEQKTPTFQYIKQCKQRFINNIYNAEELHNLDSIFYKDVKQKFKDSVNKYLQPLCSSWNANMPKNFEIWCTYGRGSGYWRVDDDTAVMLFRVSRFPNNPTAIFNIMFHEFVHILIEEPIIRKYNVPQDIKERIVDIICFEFIKKPVQPKFENSFANTYITADVIKTDLPKMVEKMMNDYTTLKINH